MNEREAQELLDFLAQHGVTDLELDQTGGNVYAVIRRDEVGVQSIVPVNDGIIVYSHLGTGWENGDEPSSSEFYSAESLGLG